MKPLVTVAWATATGGTVLPGRTPAHSKSRLHLADETASYLARDAVRTAWEATCGDPEAARVAMQEAAPVRTPCGLLVPPYGLYDYDWRDGWPLTPSTSRGACKRCYSLAQAKGVALPNAWEHPQPVPVETVLPKGDIL